MRCNPARRFQKTPAVFQPFDIKRNRFSLLIATQVFEGVDNIDIAFVAHTDRLAETDPLLLKIGQGLCNIGSALRGHPEKPRRSDQRDNGYIQGQGAVNDAHTVWAEEANSITGGRCFELFFKKLSFGTGLPEAGGDNDSPFSANLTEIFENLYHLGRWQNKHYQVGRFWQIKRRGISFIA